MVAVLWHGVCRFLFSVDRRFSKGTILACFTRDTSGPIVRIDGNLDGPYYRDILTQHLIPFTRDRLVPDYLFQQDSASAHTSQLMMGPIRRLPSGRKMRLPGFFALNGIKLFRTPPCSPDLSPIENLWSIVKRKLAGNRFRTKGELWTAIQAAWNSIPLDTLISLVDSMPRRLNAVIKAKGGPTKYWIFPN